MNRYFDNLDVLRTILAVIVSLGHFFIWNNITGIIPKSFFMSVDIFFVLSGFVLTQKTLHSNLTKTSTFFCQFGIKRFFRLYPLYILLFAICTILQAIEFGKEIDSFHYFLMGFFLLQAMGFETAASHLFADTTIGIAWSISVELWMGLLFFPIVFLLKNNTRVLMLISIALAIISTSMIILFSPNHLDVNLQRVSFLTFGGLRCITGLALGCISFFIFDLLDTAKLKKLFFAAWEVFTLSLTIGCFYLDKQNQFVAPYVFAIMVPTIAVNRGLFSNLLSLKVLSRLRPLSYGIYLVHPLYILLFRKTSLPLNIEYSFLYLFLVIISAIIFYKFIEKPGINFGKKFLLSSKSKT